MIRLLFRFNGTFIAGIFFLFSLASCQIFDPKEQTPSYIHIDKVDLSTNYPTQGSTSSKFTDAWVYIDDQPMGVYQLPVTFPVLKSGNHEIKVRGGIKLDGISATRSAYSMCGFYSETVNLQVNSPVTVSPVVTYFPNTQFTWKEDFESVGVSLTRTSASDTSLLITNDPAKVFEGLKSGAVYLDAGKPVFECVSSVPYNLPLGDVFLELNYKCNNIFYVGVYASGNGHPFTTLGINPSPTWNKIYINLANEIGTANSNPYQVFFSMTKDAAVDFPELYLDNIKLIHQ